MLKTINDILDAAGLKDSNRAALLIRIKDKYHIKPASDKYKYEFSEPDFNFIVKNEIIREKTYSSGNYGRKRKSMYYENKDSGRYSRLTY